jgi:hypothetical protein
VRERVEAVRQLVVRRRAERLGVEVRATGGVELRDVPPMSRVVVARETWQSAASSSATHGLTPVSAGDRGARARAPRWPPRRRAR